MCNAHAQPPALTMRGQRAGPRLRHLLVTRTLHFEASSAIARMSAMCISISREMGELSKSLIVPSPMTASPTPWADRIRLSIASSVSSGVPPRFRLGLRCLCLGFVGVAPPSITWKSVTTAPPSSRASAPHGSASNIRMTRCPRACSVRGRVHLRGREARLPGAGVASRNRLSLDTQFLFAHADRVDDLLPGCAAE